ncbi:MAG: ATP-binding protein [Nitrososphaerota archaeon]
MSELEKIAIAKAREAVMLDQRGSKAEAVAKYREAVQILSRLISLTDSPIIKAVYKEKLSKYLDRLAELGEENYSKERMSRETSSKYEKETLTVERPQITWSDVIGLDDAKQAIRESIVYPRLRPDLFPLGWPNGILLFGPPGCGKTLLVGATANEIDATLYTLDAAQVMSKWLGESEKNIADLFNKARRDASTGKPVIIFIDEVDSLATMYQVEVGGEARARNQLLKEMDGIASKNRRDYLYVIAATNKPWLLDEPFIRRFQKRIYVRHPDTNTRRLILEHYTKNLKLDRDVDLSLLASETEGYSASDLYAICLDAHMATVREMFENELNEPRPINLADFRASLIKRKPSIIKENLRKYEEWYQRYGAV